MTRGLRFLRFNAVGIAGIAVQLSALWVLTSALRLHYLPATAAAVSITVVHNFLWHRRWTWADRSESAIALGQFLRFAAANGGVSLAGNVVVMSALIPGAHMTPVVANGVAIGACGLLNFWLGDRVVFRGANQRPLFRRPAPER